MIKSNVKELMEKQGMTYARLEELTGLSSQTLTRARSDMIRECRLSTLEAIAHALQLTIKDLFDEKK